MALQSEVRQAVQDRDAARHTVEGLKAELDGKHQAYVAELQQLQGAVDVATTEAEQKASKAI